jgi:hypothetical protein
MLNRCCSCGHLQEIARDDFRFTKNHKYAFCDRCGRDQEFILWGGLFNIAEDENGKITFLERK